MMNTNEIIELCAEFLPHIVIDELKQVLEQKVVTFNDYYDRAANVLNFTKEEAVLRAAYYTIPHPINHNIDCAAEAYEMLGHIPQDPSYYTDECVRKTYVALLS